MDTRYITPETMKQFAEKYPAAYSFLIRENLKQERISLTAELSYARDARRIAWIKSRLEDMERCGLS